jgi:branched-chain amino acid transport system substrate-binding protein
MIIAKHTTATGWRALTTVALALALSAGAALAQSTTAPVLVGINIPRTGPVAPVGALIEPGIRLAVEQINAGGGIKSLGGAPIELRWADNQANPSLSASEEQRLIQQEQVATVIGGGASGAELTATQMAERLKVPHVISIATANELTERGFRYTFQVSARAVDYARGYVDFIDNLRQQKFAVNRVIVLNENSPYGSSVAKSVVPRLKPAGYEVIEHIEYPTSTSDVSSLLTRIRSANPDVVLQIGYVGDSILLWNTRRQMGMEGLPFIGITSGIGSPAFIKAVGGAANGALTLSQTNVDVPRDAVKAFARAHEAKYKVEPENNGFFGYQAVYVVKVALEAAASRNPEQIRQALAMLNLSSEIVLAQDAIRFGPTGANQESPILMLQIRDGRLVTVWPAKAASTQPDLTQFNKLRQ